MQPDALTDLIKRFQGGDNEAADQLFASYAKKLARIADHHLSARLAGREGGEDVVQSALRTFFRRHRESQFRIDSSAELWRLLVTITIRKARAKVRYHTAGIRDVGAERADPDEMALLQATARAPGPDEATALVDQIETLLRGLSPEYGRILGMLLEGQRKADIARELSISRTSVHRVLNEFRRRLAETSPDS
jgi:DNA-directed RNA polymerase specialized sigma24 family protein